MHATATQPQQFPGLGLLDIGVALGAAPVDTRSRLSMIEKDATRVSVTAMRQDAGSSTLPASPRITVNGRASRYIIFHTPRFPPQPTCLGTGCMHSYTGFPVPPSQTCVSAIAARRRRQKPPPPPPSPRGPQTGMIWRNRLTAIALNGKLWIRPLRIRMGCQH
jgi:hypothetical protein